MLDKSRKVVAIYDHALHPMRRIKIPANGMANGDNESCYVIAYIFRLANDG